MSFSLGELRIYKRELKITQGALVRATGIKPWKFQLLVRGINRLTEDERACLRAYLSSKAQMRMKEVSDMHGEILKL